MEFSSRRSEDEDSCSTSFENLSIFDEKIFIRISTAPARPLSDLEEFKRSPEFLMLEQIILFSVNLKQKEFKKIDLDSKQGQKAGKKYLAMLEKLCEVYGVKTTSREYRESFSKAYKILYKEDRLCYLTEILDSAQEAFPYLWVNGEKYVFSTEVLECGIQLVDIFNLLQNCLRNCYNKILIQENSEFEIENVRNEIEKSLYIFDRKWAEYEKLYVNELMIIEKDSRRFIYSAIEIVKELESTEIREKIKGKILMNSPEYQNLRKKLAEIISEINSVANIEGKGRSDLDFQILLEADSILRKISRDQSQAVRNLAEKIRNSFMNLRSLFKKYENNIEMVDPQLKNNLELVTVLNEYENSWEKGKYYFLDSQKLKALLFCSHIIEALSDKYKEFKEQIECRESEIFISIPEIMILKKLDDEDKNICSLFLSDIEENLIFISLKEEFLEFKKIYYENYLYYNEIEQFILNISNIKKDKINEEKLKSIVHKIKQIAIEMQRKHPMDWNSFIDSALI